MAKNKKTLDELLQEAIVKDAPYEVPENWVWSELGYVSDWSAGGTPKSTIKEYYNDGNIPWLVIADLNDKYIFNSSKNITNKGLSESSAKLIPIDSILVAMYGSIGKLGINKISCSCNQAIAFTKKIKYNISNMYLYYYLLASRGYLISLGKGGTQQNISLTVLKKVSIPIPPLKEQERIVQKIECLFEKLDKANELIEEVREDFEKRKASILEKAFRGELTEKWRKENKYDYEWKTAKFDEVAEIKSNLVNPLEYLEFPHIAPDCIEKNTGLLLKYNTIREDNVKSAKHKFFKGQIIYSKIRPYLSKVILAEFDGLCSADMYPIETNLYTKYLYKYMLSKKFLSYACNAGSRSLLPKINKKELGKIPIVFPPLEEQKEIVRILDKLLDQEGKIEKLTNLQNQIELTKKAILAKAFRGELGTNDPSEESAMELLKEVLQEKL